MSALNTFFDWRASAHAARTARNTARANMIAATQLQATLVTQQREHEYRYATDPIYRNYVDVSHRNRAAIRTYESQVAKARSRGRVLLTGRLLLLVGIVLAVAALTLTVWPVQLVAARRRRVAPAYWQRPTIQRGATEALKLGAAPMPAPPVLETPMTWAAPSP